MRLIQKVASILVFMILVMGIGSTAMAAEDVYVVESGDVLWKIARANNTTWESLAEINSLDNPHLIFPGQQIVLNAPIAVEGPMFKAEIVKVPSRGVEIPGVFTYPINGDKFPLVVMAHGHGGSKDEAGGFIQLSEILADNGIASIRVDFPGCGDSTESWEMNNLTNMLTDIESSLNYAIGSGKVDPYQVSMHGYSMGGRLAVLSVARDPIYKSVSIWAPAATNGSSSMYVFMGGQEAYETYNAEAVANGSYLFTTIWGQEQLLGKKFFEDMNTSNPLDEIASYPGPALIVNGSLDIIIDPATSEAVFNGFTSSSNKSMYTVEGADHGFGLYSGQPELTSELIKVTTEFLIQNSK